MYLVLGVACLVEDQSGWFEFESKKNESSSEAKVAGKQIQQKSLRQNGLKFGQFATFSQDVSLSTFIVNTNSYVCNTSSNSRQRSYMCVQYR